ncbi:MAG: YbaK/EbsC family protein [Actinomycetota bacterium]|nr:YbaK/EbsC family protein [Actinomycetota bacterium]
MAICPDVKKYLEKKGVSYEHITHPQVFSCIEEAKALRIEADEIAKNLIVKIKDRRAFAVLPGAHRLDMHKLREVMGSSHARLIMEEEMGAEFPRYEIGAVPPLGELFGIPVYVDKRLLDHETVIFTGGTHTDSIRMNCRDFVNLVNPRVVDLAEEV